MLKDKVCVKNEGITQEILDGAPDKATHVNGGGMYYESRNNLESSHSLSDLRAQIELIEENERLVERVKELENEDGYCNDEMSWECAYDAIDYYIDENTKIGDVFTFNAYSWVKDKSFTITNINDDKGTFDFKDLNND